MGAVWPAVPTPVEAAEPAALITSWSTLHPGLREDPCHQICPWGNQREVVQLVCPLVFVGRRGEGWVTESDA